MELLAKYWKYISIVFVVSMLFKPILCFLIIGTFFAVIGIYSAIRLLRLHRVGRLAAGTIQLYEPDDEGYQTPVIEYTTERNELIRSKPSSQISSDLDKLQSTKNMIGRKVMLKYNPDHPDIFVIADELRFQLVIDFVISIIGVGILGVTVASFLGYINIGL